MKTIKNWVTVVSLQLLTTAFLIAIRVIQIIVPKNTIPKKNKHVIVLTATFYSDNWISSHLEPLAGAQSVRKVFMVASRPVPKIAKVKAIYAPQWMLKTMGEVPARLIVFIWMCLKVRPDIVGGFHLLLNGVVASLLASFLGSDSLYFCGGGIREVAGGGYETESRLFGRLMGPNDLIERNLLALMSTIDITITMGSSAVRYFKRHGVKSKFYIVPGGFDGARFYPESGERDIDLVLVGRLSEVKCVDVFLEAVKFIKNDRPEITAMIVGDGPLKNELEKLSTELCISDNVEFVGMQHNVEKYLRKARIFVLTSSSEGLSLAMIEGMLCGLVPIVSDVGDLGDLVVNSQNGFLVKNRSAENFAGIIGGILKDNEMLERMSHNARKTSEKLLIHETRRRWDDILTEEA
jgi:L-malate glycosyltransferase